MVEKHIKNLDKDFEIDTKDLINEFSNNSFQVIRVGKFVKERNISTGSYQTNLSAFMFTISGSAEIKLDGDTYIANQSKFIHVCEGKQISFNVIGNNPFTYINIYYVRNDKSKSVNYMNSIFEMEIKNKEFVLDSLKNILETSCSLDITSKIKLQMQVNIFLKDLLKKSKSRQYNSEKELLGSMIEYIEKNYMKHISLKTLSQLYGESTNRILYIFYKYTKVRPIDYLIKYRMGISARLLDEFGYSVKEASEAVGYTDEFYFSRLFKKNFGVPPSKLKKKN